MKGMNRLPMLTVLTILAGAGLGLADDAPRLSDTERQQVLATIETYVREDQSIKGSFLITDPRSPAPLALIFDHVHQAVKADPEGYLACVDLKDTSGRLYDVDVVVERAGERFKVREVRLHKVEGKAIGTVPK